MPPGQNASGHNATVYRNNDIIMLTQYWRSGSRINDTNDSPLRVFRNLKRRVPGATFQVYIFKKRCSKCSINFIFTLNISTKRFFHLQRGPGARAPSLNMPLNSEYLVEHRIHLFVVAFCPVAFCPGHFVRWHFVWIPSNQLVLRAVRVFSSISASSSVHWISLWRVL